MVKNRVRSPRVQHSMQLKENHSVGPTDRRTPGVCFQFLKSRLGYSVSDVEEKRSVYGLALLMDIILPTSEQADRFLYEHLLPLIHASQYEKPMVASSGLRFLKLWLESGRKRQDDWYMSLRRYLPSLLSCRLEKSV